MGCLHRYSKNISANELFQLIILQILAIDLVSHLKLTIIPDFCLK